MAHPATIPSQTPVPFRHVFTVLNPVAGNSESSRVRQALEHHFPAGRTVCEIHEAGRDERIAEVVRAALGRGCDLVVAAGGDGTVSAVANGLIGNENGGSVPLGIIPLGTANVLARELGIPVDLERACQLLAGPHATTRIDGMRVGAGVLLHPDRRRHRRPDDPRHPSRGTSGGSAGSPISGRPRRACSGSSPAGSSW